MGKLWTVSGVWMVAVVAASLVNAYMPQAVYADASGAAANCGPATIAYYTGEIKLPADTYDVYVRLGKPGQAALVSGFVASAECKALGTVQASSGEWRKLGTYKEGGNGPNTMLQLSSPALRELPDANRPSIMLVSHTTPVCIPTTECFTTIAGQAAYLRPAGTSPDYSALHIMLARAVSAADITKVEYYADNELLYQTSQLEQFKSEYIPLYASKLVRVAYYSSGQKAVLEEPAPDIDRYGIWAVMRPYVRKYQNTIIAAGALVGLIVLIHIAKAVYAFRKRRWQWRVGHGFLPPHTKAPATPEEVRRSRWRYRIGLLYGYVEMAAIGILVIAGVVFVANTFVVQIGTVHGSSMYSTLNDGQRIVINKFPVTFARLNKTQYVPERGAIVVASPSFGAVDASMYQEDSSLIVKRVCGLPGERVVVENGSYRVFSSTYPEGFDPAASTSWESHVQRDESVERVEVTLAQNELFLCGDNQPVSIDSRVNGPISTSQVVGVVVAGQ